MTTFSCDMAAPLTGRRAAAGTIIAAVMTTPEPTPEEAVPPALLDLPPDAEERPWLSRLLADATPDPVAVAAWVDALRKPDDSPALLARRLGDRLTWLQATQGAALALPGAVPGLGTAAMIAAEASAMTAEMGLLLKNQAWMVSGIAHAYGLPPDRDARHRESLLTLGLWCGVVATCPRELGKTFAVKQVKKLPTKGVKKIAVVVGKKLVTKLGAKRGAAAVGKLVPFGIGAVIGGGFGFVVMRGFQRAAEGYFANMDADLTLVEGT